MSFVAINDLNFLVIATNLGLQLWTPDGESMQYFYSVSTIYNDDIVFLRGIASPQQLLAVGSSVGDVLVFEVPSFVGGELKLLHQLDSTPCPVTALASSSKYLVSANESGELVGFNSNEAFSRSFRFSSDGYCTSLLVHNETVIAGFASGHIRLFRANIGELTIEITAHSRPVYGLAMHPQQMLFVSCSEDQCVHFWTLPSFETRSDSLVDLLCSQRLENKMCTGVSFLQDGCVAVAAYDEHDIALFKN